MAIAGLREMAGRLHSPTSRTVNISILENHLLKPDSQDAFNLS